MKNKNLWKLLTNSVLALSVGFSSLNTTFASGSGQTAPYLINSNNAEQAPAQDQYQALAQALAHAHELGQELAQALAQNLALAQDLAHDQSQARAREIALAQNHAQALAQDQATVQELAHALAHARAIHFPGRHGSFHR